MAFKLCEFDMMVGLKWDEVEACEVRYADVLAAENIPLPSEADFESADFNGDGTLLFEEWEEWVNMV